MKEKSPGRLRFHPSQAHSGGRPAACLITRRAINLGTSPMNNDWMYLGRSSIGVGDTSSLSSLSKEVTPKSLRCKKASSSQGLYKKSSSSKSWWIVIKLNINWRWYGGAGGVIAPKQFGNHQNLRLTGFTLRVGFIDNLLNNSAEPSQICVFRFSTWNLGLDIEKICQTNEVLSLASGWQKLTGQRPQIWLPTDRFQNFALTSWYSWQVSRGLWEIVKTFKLVTMSAVETTSISVSRLVGWTPRTWCNRYY